MSISYIFKHKSVTIKFACQSRCKNYCLVHKRYFETSWCPDCSRSNCLHIYHIYSYTFFSNIYIYIYI
ncbi:uncharacterized protein BX663DRAFT_55304 [Cokeromyces recurvatus]|uniref:uncharacterized protein n=1 Tax=Cokeromyces recurvatus TaxID=90255 RepID=UPI00221E7A87|nr:uncharacterized protein BX663DRAFT_55304 [Cokeromyces recurvatus]KAI7902920.1 hypothetical protein BX663DRAFT_55304 [Cokeromyces recurvatus]